MIEVPFATPTGETGRLRYEIGAAAANTAVVAELCDRARLSDEDCLATAAWVDEYVRGVLVRSSPHNHTGVANGA